MYKNLFTMSPEDAVATVAELEEAHYRACQMGRTTAGAYAHAIHRLLGMVDRREVGKILDKTQRYGSAETTVARVLLDDLAQVYWDLDDLPDGTLVDISPLYR